MEPCQVVGCSQSVSKAGYQFCLNHWKADRAGNLSRCDKCKSFYEGDRPCPACAKAGDFDKSASDGPLLSSSKIGDHFRLSAIKINLILSELGWIERYVKGWTPTESGNRLGANVREANNGVPYVVWPDSILKNNALLNSIKEQSGSVAPPPPPPRVGSASADQPAPRSAQADTTQPAPASKPPASDDFRTKFPANFRTQDGHMVRSRAEVLIDNWLYMQGIVHAYERRLPIEEECYCDFYLPKGKGVYIEYWGLEADPKYRDRQAKKRDIYARHKFQLIELGDAEIERLDDVLPRVLLKFGIESA